MKRPPLPEEGFPPYERHLSLELVLFAVMAGIALFAVSGLVMWITKAENASTTKVTHGGMVMPTPTNFILLPGERVFGTSTGSEGDNSPQPEPSALSSIAPLAPVPPPLRLQTSGPKALGPLPVQVLSSLPPMGGIGASRNDPAPFISQPTPQPSVAVFVKPSDASIGAVNPPTAATPTPTPTAVPAASERPTATPTATPKPTATPTATPRVTPTPTATPVTTPTPTVKPKSRTDGENQASESR